MSKDANLKRNATEEEQSQRPQDTPNLMEQWPSRPEDINQDERTSPDHRIPRRQEVAERGRG